MRPFDLPAQIQQLFPIASGRRFGEGSSGRPNASRLYSKISESLFFSGIVWCGGRHDQAGQKKSERGGEQTKTTEGMEHERLHVEQP